MSHTLFLPLNYSIPMHTLSPSPHKFIFSIHIHSSISFSISIHPTALMAQESEKSRITEIHVRMDCNGCVQKIKKALHSVNGISEQYIDVPQQKITIIGWADPGKIVKAIKKTRKSAVVCCQTEPLDTPEESSQGDEGDSDSKAPPPPSGESANQAPPTETASTEPPPTQPAEPTNDPPPPPYENPRPEANSPRRTDSGSRHKDVEEIHVIYHHPPDYGYRYPPSPPPPDYRYRYDFDDKIGQGYTRQMYSYQSSPGYIPSRYQTTDGPDASIPEPLSKRYGGQWDSYSNMPEFVPERPTNKRYEGEWQSYPSNARSTQREHPTNPRDGGRWHSYPRDTRDGGQQHSYPSNARSTPPEPPTKPREGGLRQSDLSNARSTPPEPPTNPREGGLRQSDLSNARSTPPEPLTNAREGGMRHSYPSNARSTTPEPATNPRGGLRNSYPSNARSTTPEPPTNPREVGMRHSYPSNARSTTPESPSNPRDEKLLHSYRSNARSATLEPPSDLRNRTDSGPEPGPLLRSLYSSSGLTSTVGTRQLYSGGPQPRMETPQPVNVTHSYNTHRPSPYVTGYEYARAPPPYYNNYTGAERYTNYTGPEHYSEDYHYGNTSSGNVASIFSDENPNSCRII